MNSTFLPAPLNFVGKTCLASQVTLEPEVLQPVNNWPNELLNSDLVTFMVCATPMILQCPRVSE